MADTKKKKIKKKRCCHCKKRIKGMIAMTCRCKCGDLCMKCYHPENHNCNFNMQEYQRSLLEKQNPLVIPSKIDKLV